MTTGLQNNGMKVGLRISSEKTKAMIVGEHQAIPLTVDQQDIEYVDKFQYLGSYMSRTGDVDTDIHVRIGKASAVFRRYTMSGDAAALAWTQSYVSTLQSSCLVPTAIFAGETWTSVAKTRHMLDVFNRRCLINILGISWKDHVSNEDLFESTVQSTRDEDDSLVTSYVFHQQDQPVQQYSGPQKVGKEEEADLRRHGMMAGHAERRLTSDGCQLGGGQVCCRWPQGMEIARRPVFQREQEGLSRSKYIR